MKYLLLICDDDQRRAKESEADRKQLMDQYLQFMNKYRASGHILGGNQLQPAVTATSVRVRDGKPLVTDGPFAETREQLGGFFLVEAKDLDEAIAIAAEIPSAKMGTIEVRPLVQASVPQAAVPVNA
jgi:hypothetical protein